MRKISISCLLLLILSFAGRAFAQDGSQTQAASKTPEAAAATDLSAHYYHIDFVVEEVGENSKPVNSRTYSCTVSTTRNERDSVRIGSKVPFATGSHSSGMVSMQYQDIGVNFDVSQVHEVGDKLAMFLGAEISTATSTQPFGQDGPTEPVEHQNSWHTPVLIPIGKSTVIFTSDNLDNKDGMQVMVTATPLR